MNKQKKPISGFRNWFSGAKFGTILFVYFTISALIIVLLVCLSMYDRMRGQYRAAVTEENKIITEQTAQTVESYVQQVMKLSDSVYYDVIKNEDPESKETGQKVTLLYNSQKELVKNIVVFSFNGEVLLTSPAAIISEDSSVTREAWFSDALNQTENMLFSLPHVQKMFENSDGSYQWVVTFSRSIELLRGNRTSKGVLMIDLSYSGISRLFDNISLGKQGYLYLVDSEGRLIYHPKRMLINSGLATEANEEHSQLKDGNHTCYVDGKPQSVSVKTIGYTGWKLIGVTPMPTLYDNNLKTTLLMVFIIGSMIFLLALVNYIITYRLSAPINELEKSISHLEAGELDTPVYIGGSYEIRQLGISISNMANRIKQLMADIVSEHEAKRKSEFDALQSQINPHFLYNTLGIIIWMIENEEKAEAVRIVTALGRFFRISLSRGKNIIPVKNELEHVRNYLMIQQRRFKDRFEFHFKYDESIDSLASMKLMLQPIAENAVYHGMEYCDGDGEITIRAYRKEDDLYFEVEDNGLGMTKERAYSVLYGDDYVEPSSANGSGIGVRNVNERIKLYFGEEYGLEIISEPDEGTLVRIHLPARNYEDMEKQ